MQPLRLLVIGTLDGSSCEAILHIPGQLASVRVVDSVDEAVWSLRNSELNPDLIVVGQQHPVLFTSAHWNNLRRAAPLIPVWRVLGSWCEGEQRSGLPPGGFLSDYWHNFWSRFVGAITRRGLGCRPGWAAPPTTSAEERLLAETAVALPQETGRVVVCAEDRASATALGDSCRLAGYELTIARPTNLTGQPLLDPESACIRAIVWDTTPEQICDSAAIRLLRAAFGPPPLLAMVDFPRPEDARQAHLLGVDHVFSKPYSIRDLLDRLSALNGCRAA
jgi:CheY-like chemotaxis protein